MSTYCTQGIILKKIPYREADQIFSIYTADRGKVSALGRGSKKIKSKLNGSLQPFAVVELMLASGKQYDHLAGVVVRKRFPTVIRDLKKIVLASYGLEVVEKLTKLGSPDRRIFALLTTYLLVLDQHIFSEHDWRLIKQAFTVKLLTLLGFAPPPSVAENDGRLNDFLRNHLDQELQADKFLFRIS